MRCANRYTDHRGREWLFTEERVPAIGEYIELAGMHFVVDDVTLYHYPEDDRRAATIVLKPN